MKKKIIVAPLNWGLGHASRCVPIIHLLPNILDFVCKDTLVLDFGSTKHSICNAIENYTQSISNKDKKALLVKACDLL